MKPTLRDLLVAVLLTGLFVTVCLSGSAQAEALPFFSDHADGSSLPPEQLLEGYIDQVFYPSHHETNSADTIGRRFTGSQLRLYGQIKSWFEQIAAGELTYTEFSLDPTLMLDQYAFTAADLGLAACTDDTGELSSEARSAINARLGAYLKPTILTVLTDCPYEQYWFDKTTGWQWSWGSAYTAGNVTLTSFMLRFYVAQEYQDYSSFTVDVSFGQRIQTALHNAEAIVEANSSLPDEAKLRAYKNAICNMTEYNDDAWADGQQQLPYGNPWQLVWLFDGDSETKVVCEGYSKAFQYLCERSSFSEDISVISVVGEMKGLGAHMWNIVRLGNGKNVLADLTNCDNGDSDHLDDLFLAGYLYGSADEGYTYRCEWYSITYIYHDDTLMVCSAADLLMSGLSYDVTVPSGVTAIADEAFYASGAENVLLPSGLLTIGKNAFGACPSLHYVCLPDTVTFIDPDAFSREHLTLIVPYQSYAMTYAQDNGIDFAAYAPE